MVENLNKEFIVYKSDLLEVLHANNKEILTEMRYESEKLLQELRDESAKLRQELKEETGKLRQEFKDETGKLRQEIQKVEIRIDKLNYWVLGIFGTWSTIMISAGLTFTLHNWK